MASVGYIKRGYKMIKIYSARLECTTIIFHLVRCILFYPDIDMIIGEIINCTVSHMYVDSCAKYSTCDFISDSMVWILIGLTSRCVLYSVSYRKSLKTDPF